MSTMTLYKYPFSSRADRVVWMLNELNFDYDVKEINPMLGEHYAPEYRALNPYAKVPTLVYEDRVYTESLAIMMYLNELHPEQPFAPKDSEGRFLMNQALSFGTTEIEAYAWLMVQATQLNMFYKWQEGTAESAKKRLEKAMPIVWQWLAQRKYVAGDEFTLADIYYYGLIRWVQMLGVAIPHDVQETYLHQIENRPHFLQSLRST